MERNANRFPSSPGLDRAEVCGARPRSGRAVHHCFMPIATAGRKIAIDGVGAALASSSLVHDGGSARAEDFAGVGPTLAPGSGLAGLSGTTRVRPHLMERDSAPEGPPVVTLRERRTR